MTLNLRFSNKKTAFLWLYLWFIIGYTQQYPVNINATVFPPYSQRLSDLSESNSEHFRIQLQLLDLNAQSREIEIGFSLENASGQTIAQTANFQRSAFRTTLTSGTPMMLNNLDLKTLLRYENLSGVSQSTYYKLLPEGAYFYTFTVYDALTGQAISRKNKALFQVRRYHPPLLTIPAKGSNVTYTGTFQNIAFQWSVRDFVPNVQYVFTLREILDVGRDPVSGFMTGIPIYESPMQPTTALLYGADKPFLQPGKRYGWQVRAIENNPFSVGLPQSQSESYFHNNGLSEIFWFDYVQACDAPKFPTAVVEGTTATVRWELSGDIQNRYRVEYREVGKSTKNQESQIAMVNLLGLRRDREYEYRIGVWCGVLGGYRERNTSEGFVYGDWQKFRTPNTLSTGEEVQCGMQPSVNLTNQSPLEGYLGINEVFTAGDFPVTVLQASGSNGVFSGVGYVEIPYLQDTKIVVKFTNIRLNSDRQLIAGTLETSYDKSEKSLQFVQEGIGEVFGDAGSKKNKVDFEIVEIKKDEIGRITVLGKPDPQTGIAPQMTLPVGSDYQLTDSTGTTWTLDEEGNITSKEEKADTKLAQIGTKNVSTSQNANFEITWDFSNSQYASDSQGKMPYKALVKGKEDSFGVVIKQKDTLKYEFHFQTDNGLKVSSESTEKGIYKLSRKGLFDFSEEEVWVVAKDLKTDKEEVIGKCVLVHLSEKEVNVVLVPLQEGLSINIDELQKIYAQVGVRLNVTVDAVFPISDKISTDNAFGDLSTYSPDQQALIERFQADRRVDSNSYYVFVGSQESTQQGYMRLGGQFGFVMDANVRTIAHELGHGIFRLEHSFKGKGDLGNPLRLMDYAGGEQFTYNDWKQINDPKLKIYAFQGQGEGAFAGGIWLTPDWKPFSFDASYTTTTDKRILAEIPQGALSTIFYKEKTYYAEFSKDGKFIGYRAQNEELPLSIIYRNVTDATTIYLFRAGDKCGESSYYQTTWKSVKNLKGTLDFSNKDIHFVSKIPCQTNKIEKTNCDRFQYLSFEVASKHYQKTATDYLTQGLKEVRSSSGRLVNNFNAFKHIRSADNAKLKVSQLKELEDKLHLLSHYTNVDMIVGFIQLGNNELIQNTAMTDMAKEAIKQQSKDGRKIVYVLVATSDYESIFGVGNFNTDSCYSFGYAESENGIVLSKYTGETIYDIVLSLYSNIEKPVIFNKFYQYADGSIQNYIYESKTHKRGYPFIKHLAFYQSKALSEKRIFSPYLAKEYPDEEAFKESSETSKVNLEMALKRETAQNGLSNKELWQELSINDLGKFREVYMDYGRNGTPDYPRYLWQNSVDTWQWGSKVTIALETSDLPPNVFYDFEKIKILDDAVYGTLDIFGAIPGLDTFTDPVGAAYAAARSDVENIVIYSASAGIPLAGAVYVRGGAKALSKADQTIALVAKQADNTDGFDLVYKNISEIEPNEFYVASSIDGKQNQEFLEQTKKYLDKNAIKKQVDGLAKAKSLPPTLSKWVDEIKDVSLRRKIENLNADDLAKLEKDFLSKSNGNELKKLITTADDLDKWKLLKEDPHYAFELAQENPNWEKWAKSNFFKEVTKKGDEFEKAMLAAVKTRTGKAYNELKKLVPDLDQRKLISQMQFCLPGKTPPCSAQGEYFVADQVWVKYDARGNIQDMIIVDTKLSEKTTLSAGQAMAKQQAGKGSLAFKPQIPKEFDEVNNVRLPIDIQQGQQIQVKAFYKMYGDGDKIFVGIK